MSPLSRFMRQSCSLIFPSRCLVCCRPCANSPLCGRCTPFSGEHAGVARCRRCFEQLEFDGVNLTCATCRNLDCCIRRQRYLWNYQGTARDLIVAMKYRPSRKLLMLAASILSSQLALLFEPARWDLIVPVPSSPGNYHTRLFSPSRKLAEYLALSLTIPLETGVIRHRHRAAPQASQHARKRLGNARRAIVAGRRSLSGESVLLVDDVVTSGATSLVAAGLLLDAGASQVDLVSLARAPTWQRNRRRFAR